MAIGDPIPGDAATDGAAAMEEVGWEIGVHLGRGVKRGGGFLTNGHLHLAKAEYGCAVYRDKTGSGPIQGGGEEGKGTVRYAVVGIGGT